MKFAFFLLPIVSSFPFLGFDAAESLQESVEEPMRDDVIDMSPWLPQSFSDSRAPCPMLNSLANHQILPHSGREITEEMLFNALNQVLHLDGLLSKTLVQQAMSLGYVKDNIKYIDLDNLQKHGAIEHDASLSRQDADVGNSTVFNSTVFDSIYYFTKDSHGALSSQRNGTFLSLENLGRYRHYRELKSAQQHPTTFTFGFKERIAAAAEAGVAFKFFKDESGSIRMEWLDMFFREEKLPFELGWEIPSKVGAFELLGLVTKIVYHSFN